MTVRAGETDIAPPNPRPGRWTLWCTPHPWLETRGWKPWGQVNVDQPPHFLGAVAVLAPEGSAV